MTAGGCYAPRALDSAAILAELRAARDAPLGQSFGREGSGEGAAVTAPLSEEDALRIALARSAPLQATQARTAVARAGVELARMWPASDLRINDLGWAEGLDTLDRFHLGIRWFLPHTFAHGARVDEAEAAIPVALADEATREARLVRDVRLGFLALVSAQRARHLAAERRALAERRAEQVRVGVDRGALDPQAAFDAQRALLRRWEAERAASAEERQARAALGRQLGLTPRRARSLTITAVSRPDDGSEGLVSRDALDALEERAVASRPELRRARASFIRAELGVRSAHDERLPTLRFIQLAYEYEPWSSTSGFQASIAVQLPLFTWFAGDVAMAEARRDQAAMDYRVAMASVLDDVDASVEAWQIAQERVRDLRERILPAQHEAVEAAERAVAAGHLPPTRLLVARDDELALRERLLRAEQACREAAIEMAFASGQARPGP